ncbi:MAG: hypothetical protein E6K80_09945 [Candidatus Eisenbacteria bacterium]|uniref:FlgD/Vpr Ig-like domain-containing protein n=1 Tax=Eiseniibacteriota bacterium TaxID=2212470 RepID=A0A538U2I7_UNCEI|nr:MAG: hypothetical protein E6K80_09945 [Candidatus Eisenbacteria bacterium]
MQPHRRTHVLIGVSAISALCAFAAPLFAADANGIPICTAPADQLTPATIADGAGGAIVAWHDNRPTVAAGGVCFAQRLSATGAPQWLPNGVALSTTGDLGGPVMVPDGAGGAFVAYGGDTSSPRVQRVNASGAPQWGPDGVELTTNVGSTRDLAITPDIGGAGGVIVAWRQDNGVGGTSDVVAQKVNASGVIQWAPSGIAVANSNSANESLPALLSDGAGGAFYVWNAGPGIKIQRRNASGNSVWSQEPLAASANNNVSVIVADGAGGVVVAWAGPGIFVQRVSSTGVRMWSPAGGGVSLATSGTMPTMIADGAGGAILTWQDNRSGTNFNLYAQKMSSSGSPLWALNGSEVCTATADQRSPMIISDGSGGALIAWYDARKSPNSGLDIYAQRLDGNGLQQWMLDGIPLCTAQGDQDFPTIASDGSGGGWVAWEDLRSGNRDIDGEHVNGSGTVLAVPAEPVSSSLVRAWPDPFSDHVQMSFALPTPARVHIAVFDLRGRAIADLGATSLTAGIHRVTWDGRASDGHLVGAGIYFLRIVGPGITFSRSVVRLN